MPWVETSGDAQVLEEPQVIEFPAGIPGFETCRRFVLVSPAELAPLQCLQILDAPGASFLTLDPALLDRTYDLTLREFERVRLGATEADVLLWLAIVTMTAESASANLRAPIVINPRRMIGCQFIRDDADYPIRFPIKLE
jgi:flagellar assembly factor FliW